MTYFQLLFRNFLASIALFSLLVSFSFATERYTVVIDPGHGGIDPGAYRYTVKEKDLALKVAHKVKTLLEAHGVNVVMTRTYDKTLKLETRAAIANKYKNSIFVSIHFNAAEKGLEYATGIETFYMSASGKKLASAIQKQMLSKLNGRDRKVKFKDFKVLEKTKSPAILVECGFISNYSERQQCASSWYQSLCAGAIVKGILNYNQARF